MFKVINIHSLFWKIFFAFWLALLLIVLITAFLTNYIINFEDRRPLGPVVLEKNAARAIKVYEEEGNIGLRKYFDEVHDAYGVNEFLFDIENNELTNKTYPYSVQRALVFEDIEDNYKFVPSPVRTGALKYETETGNRYIFVSQMLTRGPDSKNKKLSRFGKRGPLGPPLEMYTLLITVSLFVTGLISYLLSSYLVTPIQRVRAATKKLSEGDLSVRVTSTVSPRKDELGGLGKDFDQMASRLESLMSSQQRMLRDVSHELRTPLARLLVALELARTKSKGASKNEHDRIEYETQRLNHLIGQILELVRMEQRESTLALANENVTEIVRQVVKDANFEAVKQNKGVQLIAVEDCYLEINAELIHSAIENVVRNAVKFTPKNSNIEVSVEKHTADKDYLTITVRDFGPGVPSEALEQLFEPFYKIRSRDDVDSSGYGIGLTIAERAVRLHNGMISAKNGEVSGLVIIIKLPIN
ncbi:Copper sensory histidine kinase CpxA [Candidatus Nitrotoga sp. BS]|uniref:ATP-binding protein n=1 Tax=Candidatus Nitrotoga sp. BS TaxID=2890408 RepID=UPI001EF1FDF2|nr:ATP-binding protein [Candidatus Nitrotoga sp. BS]CAH1205322.1 Copper sensory histidine kinase CpxA [Candidatus Nitrotoga sp. BS]